MMTRYMFMFFNLEWQILWFEDKKCQGNIIHWIEVWLASFTPTQEQIF